jgi:hypothetical protein
MADEVGGFMPYVRGLEHAHVLLPPLETLCIVEETVVREKAVESLCSIGAQMKESDVVDWFIPLVKVSIRVSVLSPFFLLCLSVSLFFSFRISANSTHFSRI